MSKPHTPQSSSVTGDERAHPEEAERLTRSSPRNPAPPTVSDDEDTDYVEITEEVTVEVVPLNDKR